MEFSEFNQQVGSPDNIPSKNNYREVPSGYSPPEFDLSPSVNKALKNLSGNDPIDASMFAREVLGVFDHVKEYAGGQIDITKLVETPTRQTAQEWLFEIQSLFNPLSISTLTSPPGKPVLHGRLVIIALCLLEPQLREQLEDQGAYDKLIAELREPLKTILSRRGLDLFKPVFNPNIIDSVPNWPDDPLTDKDNDLLGRSAFARFLARRISVIPKSEAYAIHLYGPWGAGKTTLMNFVGKELENQGWLVVEFNAWRNQHIQPPWWALIDQVYQKIKSKLSRWSRFQEFWWRLTAGRLLFVYSLVLLVWIVVLILPVLRVPTGTIIGLSPDTAEGISKILALITTIWGGIQFVNRSLVMGSYQAAKSYTELTQDPMKEIKERFENLIDHTRNRVAIFVDDLDRCQSNYVVDLLEGIQTLFRRAPVVFLVAADRRWLRACYEEVYEKLEPRITDPGKILGDLFLEKAFRFSTPLPGISFKLKQDYLSYLLQVKAGSPEIDPVVAREQARARVRNVKREGELLRLITTSKNEPFVQQRALREEAAVHLAAPEVQERIEHSLLPYTGFLEDNPRMMKRLVNTYSANRALAFLSEVDIEEHQLALWTILSIRWPQLADFLIRHPEKVTIIGYGKPDGIDNRVSDLFSEDEVIHVVRGVTESVSEALTVDTLQKCRLISP